MCQLALQAPDLRPLCPFRQEFKSWQFSSGNGSTCISHCQAPLKDPCALLFSRAPFFCPGLGTKGTAALEVGTVAGLANIPCIAPLLAVSPTPLHPVITGSSRFLELASNLSSTTELLCCPHKTRDRLPHGNPSHHTLRVHTTQGAFGGFVSGQLPRDPGLRKSQKGGKDALPFQLLWRMEKAGNGEGLLIIGAFLT